MTAVNPMTCKFGHADWQQAERRKQLRLFAVVCLGGLWLMSACAQTPNDISPYALDLSLSESVHADASNGVDERKPTVDGDEKTDSERADDDAADSIDIAHCSFEEPRKIEVKSPVRVATYTLDTLGILEATTSNKTCLEALIRDGAQILSQENDRITAFYTNRFEAFLADFSSEIDVDAIEGRYDFEKGRLIAGIDGKRVDREKTRAQFFKAVLSHEPHFDIAIETTHALSHDVHDFEGWAPQYRIGHYTTRFSKAKNRTVNVKLAASAMNGIFLMPGAEFSYNAWVGERSEARGFKEAPVIEQGQLVEGLGGGACQVSSTIHAAALVAGLGIVERYNHSLPSSYIPVGMDAVVSYPILDLRVSNPFSVPVVLKVTTKDDLLTAEFFSSEPRNTRVLFRKEIVEEIPFHEVITVDPALEEGIVKIRKRGKPGYKVQRGRIFWQDGKETFEKLNQDIYQSQTQQTSIALGVVYPVEE